MSRALTPDMVRVAGGPPPAGALRTPLATGRRNMPTILVATRDGVATCDRDGRALDGEHPGRSVTGLGRMRDDVWAIVDAAEIAPVWPSKPSTTW